MGNEALGAWLLSLCRLPPPCCCPKPCLLPGRAGLVQWWAGAETVGRAGWRLQSCQSCHPAPAWPAGVDLHCDVALPLPGLQVWTFIVSDAALILSLLVIILFLQVWTFIVSDAVFRLAPTQNSPRRDEQEVKVDQVRGGRGRRGGEREAGVEHKGQAGL